MFEIYTSAHDQCHIAMSDEREEVITSAILAQLIKLAKDEDAAEQTAVNDLKIAFTSYLPLTHALEDALRVVIKHLG